MTSPWTAALLVIWAFGAGGVGTYFFRIVPSASPGAAKALASDDPATRREAMVLIAFISVLFGALWPIMIAFLASVAVLKKRW